MVLLPSGTGALALQDWQEVADPQRQEGEGAE